MEGDHRQGHGELRISHSERRSQAKGTAPTPLQTPARNHPTAQPTQYVYT